MENYAQHILNIHKKLGIPADYEQQYGLPRYEEANELVNIGLDIANRERQLTPEACERWQSMKTQAAEDGVVLQIVSAYRSVDYQCQIIENKLGKGQSIEDILHVSAAPGHSEHHTGRALDLTTPGFTPLEEEFENSEAFKWLRNNAANFSFYLSYPRGSNSKIAYEPWHWAYRAVTH